MPNDSSLTYQQYLRFPAKTTSDLDSDDTIALPDIHPYCPPKTDPDTAEALVALYRTHSTSLIDCIRFLQRKAILPFVHLIPRYSYRPRAKAVQPPEPGSMDPAM